MPVTFIGQDIELDVALTPRIVPMGIYGHVTSISSGEPIPNALIQAYYVKAAFTDINGYYEIKLYTPGSYTVVCYGESHVTGLSSINVLDEAIEVNFNLELQPGIAEPMYPLRKIIYCGASPHIPPILLNKFEVISDEGYADNIHEWLADPSIEYAYLVATHGSSSGLWLKCRTGELVLYAWDIRGILGDRDYKLSYLGGCNTVDADGSLLASGFGGSVLGQSKLSWRAGGIEFFTYLSAGLSAFQAYVTCKSYVTDPATEVGLLTYYGDNRPGFRLG